MVGQRTDGVRHTVKAALFFDAVVAIDREQRGPGILRLLGLDDVADIDQLVAPGLQRNDFGRRVLVEVRDDAAGYRRDDLLAQRRIGRDAVVDRVAAGFLVFGDDLFERDILFLGEALDPPDRGRRC